MDIRMCDDKCLFKARAIGVLQVDNKILCCTDGDNHFFSLPGGHIHVGENSTDAALREFEEETQIKCDDAKLFAIIENFFYLRNKEYHEYTFCFKLSTSQAIEAVDKDVVEDDHGEPKRHYFKWIETDKLKNFDIRPAFLIKKIQNGDFAFEHIISDNR